MLLRSIPGFLRNTSYRNTAFQLRSCSLRCIFSMYLITHMHNMNVIESWGKALFFVPRPKKDAALHVEGGVNTLYVSQMLIRIIFFSYLLKYALENANYTGLFLHSFSVSFRIIAYPLLPLVSSLKSLIMQAKLQSFEIKSCFSSVLQCDKLVQPTSSLTFKTTLTDQLFPKTLNQYSNSVNLGFGILL